MTRPRGAYRTPHRLRSGSRAGGALLLVLAFAVLGPLAMASSAAASDVSAVAASAFADPVGDDCKPWEDFCNDDRDCKPWEDFCNDDDRKCRPWWKCNDDRDRKCRPWWKCDDDRATAPRFRLALS